jgi:hypothetical protein
MRKNEFMKLPAQAILRSMCKCMHFAHYPRLTYFIIPKQLMNDKKSVFKTRNELSHKRKNNAKRQLKNQKSHGKFKLKERGKYH